MVEEISKKEKVKKEEIRFSRRDICKYTGWGYWQIRPHLDQLLKLEYLYMHNGKQGQRHSYELIWDGEGERGDKFLMGLIDINKLKTLHKK